MTSPTVLATNVGNNRFVIQVCPSSVRLLDATATIVQELEMGSDFLITSASASDPYIALMATNGRIGLLKFVEGSQLEIVFPIPSSKVELFLV